MSMDVIITKITKNVDESVRKLTLDLDKGIVMSTPVGDPTYWKRPPPPGYVGGRARGNWQPSVGEPITTEIDRIDASGNDVMADIERVVPKKQVRWCGCAITWTTFKNWRKGTANGKRLKEW